MTQPVSRAVTRGQDSTRLKQTLLRPTTKKSTSTSKQRQASAMPANISSRSYWLITTSRDHVFDARALSIVQANHGLKAPMQRMRPGDGVVFYSPRYQIKGKEPCQRFTGIATVSNGDVYQEEVTETFKPWRRKASFEEQAKEVDVKAVIKRLECLKRGETGWGWVLRRGCVRIPDEDWKVLWDAMTAPEK